MPLRISLATASRERATAGTLGWLSSKSPRYQPAFALACRLLSLSASQRSSLEGHAAAPSPPVIDGSRLNPSSTEYSRSVFQDKCTLTVQSGGGGNGCVSFVREKYIPDGPPNGGNGGAGGNIFIQAVDGLTSLHKLARSRVIRAKRGRNGQGKAKGGQRGDDVLITVPVGTIVREVSRYDPVAEAQQQLRTLVAELGSHTKARRQFSDDSRHWVLFPGALPSDFFSTAFPVLPPPQRAGLAAAEPPAPVYLDLSQPMESPMLLLAGGVGGLGNPNYMTRLNSKPKFATRGERGTRLELELELKMLADVGLVGLPNAGKSTLLRSISNSRTRIGEWAFTTLSPYIGTVVVDNNEGRPLVESFVGDRRRTSFTVADIPGLIEDAHLDRGFGSGFLRHVERAAVLAFVVDLSAGDAVHSLKGLWHELNQYQQLRDEQLSLDTENRLADWRSMNNDDYDNDYASSGMQQQQQQEEEYDDDDDDDLAMGRTLQPPSSPSTPNNPSDTILPPVYSKPWLVIGTKADTEGTQENFFALRDYLAAVEQRRVPHPSGNNNAWHGRLFSIPVSAINAEGVDAIAPTVVSLLDGHGSASASR